MNDSSRRGFLITTGSTALAWGGFPAYLAGSRKEIRIIPAHVERDRGVADLVRRIEQTRRTDCPAFLARELKRGTPFRSLLAAALLYAVSRQGHHSVYLVHSAYQMTLDAAPTDRLLPLFWAVDVMKEHIPRFGLRAVPPLGPSRPNVEHAARELKAGLDGWDQQRAEAAAAALVESGRMTLLEQVLLRYGARDWSFIGHLPIAAMSAIRVLEVIGRQHALQIARYVVREFFVRNQGRLTGQPYATHTDFVRRNRGRVPARWTSPRSDPAAVTELLQVIRRGRWQAASEWVRRGITAGRVTAGSVWDAVHLAAAEFLVRFRLGGRRLSNRALHSNTCVNAMHYSFRRLIDEGDRLLVLLQAVAWVTDFLRVESSRRMLRDLSITDVSETRLESPAAAVDAIFAALPPRPFRAEIHDRTGQDRAFRIAFALVNHGDERQFLQRARQLLCRKATINAHDYKLPIAMFEDRHFVSRRWRPNVLAASVHFLHGTRMPDNPVVAAAEAALRRG